MRKRPNKPVKNYGPERISFAGSSITNCGPYLDDRSGRGAEKPPAVSSAASREPPVGDQSFVSPTFRIHSRVQGTDSKPRSIVVPP